MQREGKKTMYSSIDAIYHRFTQDTVLSLEQFEITLNGEALILEASTRQQ